MLGSLRWKVLTVLSLRQPESSTCFGCAKDLVCSCPERETWKGIGKKGNRRAIEMGQLLAVGGKDQEKGK